MGYVVETESVSVGDVIWADTVNNRRFKGCVESINARNGVVELFISDVEKESSNIYSDYKIIKTKDKTVAKQFTDRLVQFEIIGEVVQFEKVDE